MANTGDMGAMALANSSTPGMGSIGPESEAIGHRESDLPPDQLTQPSTLEEDALLSVLKGWWKADSEHSMVWRNEAKEDFDFRAGDQWTPEDRQLLNAQQRPHIVFNRVLTILKAVAGMEINGRHEISFIPRNTQETAVNEVLTATSKWMADGCDAEDEESAAFEDTATCGMGWCECGMDYTEQWNGKYREEKLDPLEMYWDRTAKKKNLTDARRLSRVRKMPLGDAVQLFPNFDRAALDAAWAVDSQYSATKTLEEKRRREENTTETTYDDTQEVTIVHMQWWEREHYWKIGNLQTGQMTELEDEQYQVFSKRMKMLGGEQQFKSVRLTRKIYKHAFLGNRVLLCENAPLKDQFSWKCITGELNHTKGIFFGLVRVMRDPQMWSNKWLSQVLHILNTTAKGGIIAEEDAFAGDQREFEDKYARPDSVTWVNKGAISGQKIMAKPGPGMTQGHVDLMQYAISSIRDTTGINLELLGQQDQNQPGILESYRKQAGMTILATLFDSLRRFRKLVGHARLYIIQNYLADGRLVRVVGQDGAKALPLLKDKCLGEYDAVVDDTPTSPNMKEANWAVIQPMLGIFKDQLVANPEVLVALLEYSPLPNRVVEMLRQFAAKGAADPQSQQMKNLQIAKIVAGINKDQSTAEMQDAKAGASQATAAYDVAMAQHLLTKGDFDQLGQHLAHMKTASEIQATQAQTAHTQAQMGHTHAKTLGEHASTISTMAGDQGDGEDGAMASSASRVRGGTPEMAGATPFVGARRARDGNIYSPDPNRPGKFVMLVPREAA